MIKFIKRFIKQLVCKHEWLTIAMSLPYSDLLYGISAQRLKCTKCGKIKIEYNEL